MNEEGSIDVVMKHEQCQSNLWIQMDGIGSISAFGFLLNDGSSYFHIRATALYCMYTYQLCFVSLFPDSVFSNQKSFME